MMNKNFNPRTREEIMAWLNRAREIKEARQKEAHAKWEERQRRKLAAEKSGYYDLEWV